MTDFDVHADVRDPILKARAITEMVRLAAQSNGDELRPAMLYEVMLAMQDYLDAALAGLRPLIDEDEQAVQDAMRRKGRVLPGQEGGVSANRLYGFEQFILQSVQSGHVKVTFEREGRLESGSTLESSGNKREARIRRNP
jgi:hypothetical protein